MRIVLVAKPGHEDTGVGRYARELSYAMIAHGHEVTIIHPLLPFPAFLLKSLKNLLNWDLQAFFHTYPIWVHYPEADIYHLTSQNLATLMFFHPPPGKTLVTVHDIIPKHVQVDPNLNIYQHKLTEFFDRLAMNGLQKVDGILYGSVFSRQIIESSLNLPAKIKKTVRLGVN